MRGLALAAFVFITTAGAARLNAQPASHGTPAQPFGLRLGLPAATLREQYGARFMGSEWTGMMEMDNLPAAGRFSHLNLLVSPVSGLCTILAFSTDIATEDSGEEARAEFAAVRDSLNGIYGGSDMKDFITPSSIYQGREYWMAAIRHYDRVYRATWVARTDNFPSSANFPPEFLDVSLSIRGSGDRAAQLVLIYRSAANHECIDEMNAVVPNSPVAAP
jgi:hypothetical protein